MTTTAPERFVPLHRCAACEAVLTDRERMYSGGVCPVCGAVTKGTIVHTIKTSVSVPPPKPAWWRRALDWLVP